MLIITLLKGVPSKTTQSTSLTGILNRESMEIVLNPHDLKAVEAADYIKRRVGGKTIALTMGPEGKLSPIVRSLYTVEVYGVDESIILSDRKMAGADTLATAYAVANGVKTAVERHLNAVDEILNTVDSGKDALLAKADELYRQNLLPNSIYSNLPAVKDSIVNRLVNGELQSEAAKGLLESIKLELGRFIVVAGIKTTDGETGSVGPQVAEGLSELYGRVLPHATYVEHFEIEDDLEHLVADRILGQVSQRLRMAIPCLLTISDEYEPTLPNPLEQHLVRRNNYMGKTPAPIVWTANDIHADPLRLGLGGSPTIVGPGVDVGKPPVQKMVDQSLVFFTHIDKMELDGKMYGPFDKGDLADGLPPQLMDQLRANGSVGQFTVQALVEELFA